MRVVRWIWGFNFTETASGRSYAYNVHGLTFLFPIDFLRHKHAALGVLGLLFAQKWTFNLN
jgi:hypothetical protein